MTQSIEVNLLDFLNCLENKFAHLEAKLDRIQSDVTDIKIDVGKLKAQNEQMSK